MATFPAEFHAGGEFAFDANVSSDEEDDALAFTWVLRQDGEPLEFVKDLTGARLLVRFRSTDEQCVSAGEPCLALGEYTIEVTADDGFGGVSTSEPVSFSVLAAIGGESGGVPPGRPTEGEPIPIVGSGRAGSGGGLCGMGVLMPLVFGMLALTATMVSRRKR